MPHIRISSPHVQRPTKTADIMRLVIIATLPGLFGMTFFFGWGTLINVVLASVMAISLEAICIKLRRRPVLFYVRDNSALLTAILLALALPPFAPWWVTATAVFVAIVIAKQIYGGLGQNPFNPAMVGYALVLISFPVEMTRWTAPFDLNGNTWEVLGFADTLTVIFGSWQEIIQAHPYIDSFTSATPLDTLKHRNGLTVEEVWQSSEVMANVGAWYAVSLCYFVGGIFLIYRKIYTWHAPLTLLITLALISAIFFAIDPDNYADPLIHLTTGATMLGAFFIVTDPVSSATSNRGKVVFAAGIAILVYIVRTWGNYPDALAFAVMLMNLCAPFIDQYTQPRSYGYKKPNSGQPSKENHS
ncbi:MAG: electron transport complex protein RnfD [Osedax symbiont Rs1]|nr:MAG: electron transport complex protein RnfD [Osedax symbiont Rs1]